MVASAAMAVFLSAALLGGGIACCGYEDDIANRGDGWGNVEREIRVFSWQKLCGRDKMEPLGYIDLFIDDGRRIRPGCRGTRPVQRTFISWRRPKTCLESFFHGWLCRRWR